MQFNNLLEERVSKLTEEYLTERGCDSECKIKYDIIVYTLNRLPAQYVLSGRGILYTMLENEKPQMSADILKVINEAYILFTSREGTDTSVDEIVYEEGEYEIYPEIAGTIFDGTSFIRINEASVCVKEDDKILEGYGGGFPNPYKISHGMRGQYIFRFVPVKYSGEKKKRILSISVEAEGFSPYTTYIKCEPTIQTISKTSQAEFPIFHVEHIYLTKEEDK